ncbi:o-succinylbenzoate synthase [Nocardia ignorata]|uniref:o-succinylbenzoate synthase n=1 Tax=Nocardia ignorata TaxID=145285 RepID=A0A4R6PXP3_NOCIG|nr:o-succinylbenzoate synthase [Nocardia ignorata]TDP43207.1 O-succinylbenzoate synthase [Nocardia ignorata]
MDFETFVYAIPLRTRFRGITVREGMLIRGENGWGEFCAFPEYDDREAAGWLATAVEQATIGWPAPVRERVPVNCIVPAVDPERAARIARQSGCATAKVKVADHSDSLAEDLARVAAVRAALGDSGAVRVDANAVWDVETAVRRIREIDSAARGLQYVEQPCRSIEELAEVRARVSVPIAADESIRRAEDPLRVAVAGAADVAVLKCTPLGGVRRALAVAEAAELPTVVSSALETSVGLAAQIALAGTLPDLEFACGLGTLALFEGDLVADSLRPVDGWLTVPTSAPEPDPVAMDRYRHPDAERVRWWLRRYERVRALLEDTPASDSVS